MQAVKIRILSTTKEGGGAAQSIEQRYKGTMAAKNGKYYVMYNEDAQSGLEGTKTTVKWDQQRVIILRSGTVTHRQEFYRGYLDQSVYRTPYMTIPLTTETSYLYTYFRDGVWRLEVEYTLYHGDAPYGEMKILIEIEEDTEVGH